MLDRDNLIRHIAEEASESIDMKDLIQFFYEKQIDYLDDLSDEDLITHAYDYCSFEEGEVEDEFQLPVAKGVL